MKGIDNNYIKEALKILQVSVGIKDYVDDRYLQNLTRNNNVKEAIKEIANYLGLPVEINITYVPEGYSSSLNKGFQSTGVVETDKQRKGTEGITAQVKFPSDLPLYGDSKMIKFPIEVMISENILAYPYTFIGLIAHELSHIVLYSLRHQEKDNEFYTDLTAMLLGFALVMKSGRIITLETKNKNIFGTFSTTETIRYGYLSDDNFNFAFENIDLVLQMVKTKKIQFLDDLKLVQDNLYELNKQLNIFKKCIEYIDNKPSKKVSIADGYLITSFHQPNYLEEIMSLDSQIPKEIFEFEKYISGAKHYKNNIISQIEKYVSILNGFNNQILKKSKRASVDIKIMLKYQTLWEKTKYKLSDKI